MVALLQRLTLPVQAIPPPRNDMCEDVRAIAFARVPPDKSSGEPLPTRSTAGNLISVVFSVCRYGVWTAVA